MLSAADFSTHGHLSTRQGASDRGHRCPRSAAHKVFEVSLAALDGAFAVLLIMAIVDPHGQASFDGVLIAGGGLAGVGFDR